MYWKNKKHGTGGNKNQKARPLARYVLNLLPLSPGVPQEEKQQQEEPGKGFRVCNHHIAEYRTECVGTRDPHAEGKDACNAGEHHIAGALQVAPDGHADSIDDVKACDGMEEAFSDGHRGGGQAKGRFLRAACQERPWKKKNGARGICARHKR